MENGHSPKHLGGVRGAGAGACSWVGGSWCDGIGGWEFSFEQMMLMIP